MADQKTTDAPSPIPPTPSVAVPSADELIAKARAAFPKIDPGVLERVIRASIVAGDYSPEPAKKAVVIRRLKVLMGVDPEKVREDGLIALKGLTEAMQALKDKFAQETGTVVAGANFEAFAERYHAELDEHQKLVALASETKMTVKSICASLGLANPDVPAKPTGQGKKNIAAEFVSALQKKMIEMELLQSANAPAAPEAPPSWLTEPVWNTDEPKMEDAPDISLYDGLMAINDVVKESNDPAAAWASLAQFRYNDQRVLKVLVTAVERANKQIEISTLAPRNVDASFQGYADVLQAIQNMMKIIKNNNIYYDTSAAPAKQAAKK